MDPSTSNVVLLRMIEFMQAEVDAARREAERAQNIVHAQQSVIKSLTDDLSTMRDRNTDLTNAGEIISRASDEMYQMSRELYGVAVLNQEQWSWYYRAMLRADVGYAILHGAQFVDLTTEEETEEEEEEEAVSRGEMEV